METLFASLSDHRGLTLGLTIASVAMFAGSIVLFPWLVAQAPADFFTRDERPNHSGKALFLRVLKNVTGLAALVLGVLMLFLPGQGLLMVVLGVSMIDFPGKRSVQTWLVRKESVQRGLAFLRRRAHKPPFEVP
jgi:hypothetical protein